jgi:O-antigen/teichoic acid export membrane protein
MDTFKNTRVISGFIWRFMERVGAQLVQFIVSIVLARILEPSAYGTVALITVFTTIMQVFVDSGLGNALIQKKNADDIDFSTVFYTNIVFCLFLYAIMWFAAPSIANFYKQPELVPYIRVLSLTIVVSGVKNIQQAYVSRNMLFKRFFFATLVGTIGAAVLGITMALHGAGVWAIIAQQLFNLTVDTCVLWITVKWRPIKAFSFERLKGLFSYGWKLLVSSLLDTGYNNLRQLLIGKIYSSSDLAYYNQGDKFPSVIVNSINTSIDSVLLPAMSSEQDHKDHVRNMTRRAIKTSTFIMAPLMIGLAACSKEVVSLILTDKWLPCVPYLQIFCISYMIWPLHTANLNAIKALGRSDMFLKLEIIKKCVGLTLLIITMRISVLAMAISLLISGVCSLIINSWPNRKLLDYRVEEQIKDILPNIIMALIMGAAVFSIGLTPLPLLLRLMIQIILGVGIYYILSKITKNDTYFYAINLIKQRKANKKS